MSTSVPSPSFAPAAGPRVGFLGLGAIGNPMAARLVPRFPLVVWNRTAARATDFAARHQISALATPREVAQRSDVLVTCVPNSAEVEALLDGPDGLLAGLAPGTLLIDCTSGSPAGSRRIAHRLTGVGAQFADAPVSGGTKGAEAGTLTIMVGADPGVFARALPVLDAMGKRIVHMGPIGSGDAMKAVNQVLLAVHLLAIGEGLAALTKMGVSPAKALEVLNGSTGRSMVSEVHVPERVLTGLWPRTFRAALLDKDVEIARGLFEELGLQAPVAELAATLMHHARQTLGEEADHVEVIRLIEEQAGVEIRG